jgi:hypothetical protein
MAEGRVAEARPTNTMCSVHVQRACAACMCSVHVQRVRCTHSRPYRSSTPGCTYHVCC